MRVSELINLKWSDIDFKNEVIFVNDSKNFTQRLIPMNKLVLDTLKSLVYGHERAFNFKSRDSVGSTWRKVRNRLNLKKYRLHDLRHTFITDLITSGVDIITIMEITGHKDIRMIKRYSHPTNSHKKQAVEKLNSNTNIDDKNVSVGVI